MIFAEPVVTNEATCTVVFEERSVVTCDVISVQEGDVVGIGFMLADDFMVQFFGEPGLNGQISITGISTDRTERIAPVTGSCAVRSSRLVCRAYFRDGKMVEVTAQ